jgi:CBS domain containing-hemolysin-like protein
MSNPAPKTVIQLAPQDPVREGVLKRFKLWLRVNLRGKANDNSLKEALEEVLEDHVDESSSPPSEEQNMLKNVITFADREVHDIMTPRPDIKGVEYNIGLPELRLHIAENNHTRIPVFNDTLDNIKGFLHVKDLVPHLSNEVPFNMALILREVLFVPPSMRLINLLVKMRDAGVHMAIVIDEYGGTDGLVTLEDLFEEIVGEIQDEHDEEERETSLFWNSQNNCDADAATRIEELDEALELSLLPAAKEHEYDTLGGLIFFTLDRVPNKGEKFEINEHLRCEILSADPRRIHRVRLTRVTAITSTSSN